MKIKSYLRSSSFVMAMLFLLLLALAAGFVIYALGVRSPIEDPVFFWLGSAALAAMLLIVIISFYISIFVVGRVGQIAETARLIMETSDYSQRITVQSRWDDLSNLSSLLNEFLSRLEIQIQNVRDVSDNIAHDLRTPLARLRGQLQNALSRPGSEAIEQAIEETDRILSTFHALLRIASIEKGGQQKSFRAFALHTLLYDVIELYEPLAEEKNIRVTSAISATQVTGDKDLLFQLFANLFDNAVKYTPAGGTITVVLAQHDGHTVISVADTGVGIPAGDKLRVFDRLYRGDSSRHTPGNGLGLSLVRAVVDMHAGTIRLEDAHPGLKITVTL